MKSRKMIELFEAMFHGKYQFQDFLECEIASQYSPMPWSGREIYKPSKKLKDFHRFISNFVIDQLPINERVAFAYLKGASPRSALERHSKNKAFFQTDLVKFFDSISIKMIHDVLVSNTTAVSDLLDYLDRILELVTIDNKLPIGFSTSPALSNACLKKFDDAFENYCETNNFTYSRYADDIIVSCQDRGQLSGIEEVIKTHLNSALGSEFHINNAKSKLTTVGRKVKVLGLVILQDGSISVDSEVKKNIEYQLHFLISDRKRLLDIYNGEIELGIQRLQGSISHIKDADHVYFDKLRKKYGATVIDGLLHRTTL